MSFSVTANLEGEIDELISHYPQKRSASLMLLHALQDHFGQPGQQRRGCGFPIAHVLAMFDATTGLLVKALAAPLRTHDMSQVTQLHPELSAGDVLVADRAFSSYVHLALILQRNLQAVFRVHHHRLLGAVRVAQLGYGSFWINDSGRPDADGLAGLAVVAAAAPGLSKVPLVWVQSRGNRDGRPILSLGDLKAMGYRGCIDAQILIGAALHGMKRALREVIETGSYTGLSDSDFVVLRQEIEDLIGLDAYYRIEAETVEPDSKPG
jgi:hypothetical protein